MLPILYQNSEFILYSYPLLMGVGWGVAYQIYFSLLDPNISKFRAQIVFWGIFLFAWLGAKIFFYINSLGKSDLLNNMNFWIGGGFVFYGGLISAILFLMIFKLVNRSFGSDDLKPMLPALVFGHALGRIGCLLAGCCYGKPTEMFWGIHLHNQFRHPTQLIEALGLFVLGIVLLKKRTELKEMFTYYLCGYGLLRLIVESLRGDVIRGQWGSLTPSEWISLVMILTGSIIYFSRTKRS